MNLKARTPYLLPAVSCALAAALLAGCHSGGNEATTSGSATPPAGAQVSLAFVTNNPSDYWTICRKGTEAAAKALPGVSVQFVMPQDGSAATQRHRAPPPR